MRRSVRGWTQIRTRRLVSRGHPGARIVELFGSGLNQLVAVLSAVPEEPPLFGQWPFTDALVNLSGHCVTHAIPLVDALPEVRTDPLVLNWLLDAQFHDEQSIEWQAKLLADAREYIANHPDEEDDDE